MNRVSRLLSDGLRCNCIPDLVSVERLKLRGRGPGSINIQLASMRDKAMLLRRKQKLWDDE